MGSLEHTGDSKPAALRGEEVSRTSTDYHRPYRTLPVAVFNHAGRLARRLGIGGGLRVDSMIAAARRKTGLDDFGDDWFVEPLNVLVKSINEEARLSSMGYALQKSRIVSALSTRLCAQHLIGKHPEILDLDLGRIILIAGLQRTATTTLHRLIAADPCIRGLRAWEALNPVPLRGEKQGDPRRRIRLAKLAEKTIGLLAPEFAAIHPIRFDAPEEDVFLLDLSFMSQSPEAMMHVPSYAAWLERQDHTRAYRYLLAMLKLLQWQRPGRNWVLKTPNHMEHLDVALRVLPKTWVIQTHRDPKQAVASFCSMVAHGRGILSDHVDTGDIARHWVRKMQRMLERSMKVRDSGNADAFVDVSYYDLVSNPIDELRAIYRHAGIEFTRRAANSAVALAARDVKDRHGKHVYSLSSFGLNAEEIDRYFAFYASVFRIPDEGAGITGMS
ncbi:MAG: sulfotransferase [Proteobacteria bacterium]|nr:sulfotransferase [Pseudomonadota bacterium]